MKNLKKGQIDCPNCGNTLNIDELLISNFEQSIRKDLQGELRRREEELQEHKNEVLEMSIRLEREKEDVDQLVSDRVKSQLHNREENLRATIRKEVQDEKTLELGELEAELMRKSAQLKDMNQTKAKIARLSREFEEREAEIHLQKEQELSERLKSMETTLKDKLQMESFLKIKEKENIIESLKNKLDDARQKATQGSMQNQGEAQELVLEEMIRNIHPTDSVEEVKKGARGADCILTVNTISGIAGTILFESKNTKTFSNEFIAKLKQDNLVAKADLMVIVTKTMPKDSIGKYVLLDGVWVTTMEGVRDLSLILRFGLLKTHAVMLSQNGKKDKMSLLYDYLTSQEFKATFENILTGFKLIQDSHHDEQRKMQLLWKKREKYLEQVLSSTIDFYGSIKGISGSSIPDIQMLEFENKKAS